MCEKADQSAATLSRQLLIARLESALVEIPDELEIVDIIGAYHWHFRIARDHLELVIKELKQGEFREV